MDTTDIIKTYNTDIKNFESNNQLLLHYCENKNTNMIDYILTTFNVYSQQINNNGNELKEKDININYMRDDHKYTPLMWCCWLNLTDSIKKILKYKPNINYYNHHYDCAIRLAIYNGNYEIIKLLIDNGADVNLILDDDKKHMQNEISPISTSVYNGNYEISKLLIDNGAIINYIKDGTELKTPLIYCAIKGYYEIARMLMMNGADTSYEYKSHRAFDYALSNNHYDICIILFMNNALSSNRCIRVIDAREWVINRFKEILQEKMKYYDEIHNILYNGDESVSEEKRYRLPKVLSNLIVYKYLFDEKKYRYDIDIINTIKNEYKIKFASQFEEPCNCNRNNNN